MNIRPWVFSIVLGAGCTALRAAPQKIASGHAENLESCVDGIGGCDTTLLTEKQRKWRKSPASATSSPAWTEPGFATSHNSPKTRNNKQKKPITTTTSRIAWKVWATATALCSAAK